jgi:hypothetical protein
VVHSLGLHAVITLHSIQLWGFSIKVVSETCDCSISAGITIITGSQCARWTSFLSFWTVWAAFTILMGITWRSRARVLAMKSPSKSVGLRDVIFHCNQAITIPSRCARLTDHWPPLGWKAGVLFQGSTVIPGAAVYNCCWASSAQFFLRPSPAGLMSMFYCPGFKTPPPPQPGGPGPLFISPRNRVAQLYPQVPRMIRWAMV